MTITESMKQEALRLGFHAVGISRVGDGLPATLLDHLQGWLDLGYAGIMSWMGRDPARRSDPRLVLPGCRSVISLGMNYYTEHRADEAPGYGRIARYAWGQDYHDVLGERLARLEEHLRTLVPEAKSRRYVDTGPVMEKVWAQQAGLGWIGKHSNLVSAQFGSWLLLGEILTTAELHADEPGDDLCGSCTLCIDACPTGAIVEPSVVDARRCVSYLTIELRGAEHDLDHGLTRAMGNRIFGCDDCLDVCPYNVFATPTREPAFMPSESTLRPPLAELSQLSDNDFRARFRGSPLTRPKLAGFLRNVRVAMTNLARVAGGRSSPSAALTLSSPGKSPHLSA